MPLFETKPRIQAARGFNAWVPKEKKFAHFDHPIRFHLGDNTCGG
jgi:hypothetical protein